MISVRPVNRILGFGMRGITALHVPLSPKLMMLICEDWYNQLAPRVSKCCFTHSASCIDCAIAEAKVMSTRENLCSAHVEPYKTRALGGPKKEKKRAPVKPDPQIRSGVQHHA